MLRKNVLICFGSPIIDIKTRVNKDFLAKHFLNEDETLTFINKQQRDEIIEEIEAISDIKIGGSVTTTSIICQKLLKQPEAVCYFGAIGNDVYGELIKNDLSRLNINFFGEIIGNKTTGICVVLLSGSNRTLITDLGASKSLSKQFLNHHVLLEGKFFYFSAFLLEISTEIVGDLLEFIIKEEKKLIFNLGAAFLCYKHSNFIKNLIKFVDVLIGNEKEFIALSKIFNSNTEINLNQFLNHLHEKVFEKSPLIIITNGPLDITVSKISSTFKKSVVKFNSLNLDTNEAGDAFVGGFLANFIQDIDLEKCIQTGIDTSKEYISKNSLLERF